MGNSRQVQVLAANVRCLLSGCWLRQQERGAEN